MNEQKINHSDDIKEYLNQVKESPDLSEVYDYIQPLIIKSHNALVQEKVFNEAEDLRKVENIIYRDFPILIENYLAMPIDYRNEKAIKSIKQDMTHREMFIANVEILVQALSEIESRNLAVFDMKAKVSNRSLKEIYEVEVELENKFSGKFDWDIYQKKNPLKIDSIHTQQSSESEIKNVAIPNPAINNMSNSTKPQVSSFKVIKNFIENCLNTTLDTLKGNHKVSPQMIKKVNDIIYSNRWLTNEEKLTEQLTSQTQEDNKYYLKSLIKVCNKEPENNHLKEALFNTIYVLYRLDKEAFNPGEIYYINSKKNQAHQRAYENLQCAQKINHSLLHNDWERDYQKLHEFFNACGVTEKRMYLKQIVAQFYCQESQDAKDHITNTKNRIAWLNKNEDPEEMKVLVDSLKKHTKKLEDSFLNYPNMSKENKNWHKALKHTILVLDELIASPTERRNIGLTFDSYSGNNLAYMYASHVYQEVKTQIEENAKSKLKYHSGFQTFEISEEIKNKWREENKEIKTKIVRKL